MNSEIPAAHKRWLASAVLAAIPTMVAVDARAQKAPAAPVAQPDASALATGTPPPPGTAPLPVASASAPAPEGSIAPPGPGATPENVEKAKKTEKQAELTPIVPSPNDSTRPAFQLFLESDLPTVGLGLVFAGARFIRTQPANCSVNFAPCDPSVINGLDRVTAGYWSPAWNTAADISLYTIGLLAAGTLILDEGFLDALNDAVVVGESALTAVAIETLAAISASRPRPFNYGPDAPLSERMAANSALSFVSGHATLAFSIVASTYMATKRLNPNTKIPLAILTIGGAAAAWIAVTRVMGGEHFITDTVAGAIVGTSVGFVIPALHNSPVRVVPVVSQTDKGLSFVGTF